MKNPADFMALEELKAAARCEVIPGLAAFHHIDYQIQKLYGVEGVKRAIEDMERRSLTHKEKNEIPKEQEQREMAPGHPPGQFDSGTCSLGTGQRYSFRASRGSDDSENENRWNPASGSCSSVFYAGSCHCPH